MTFGSLFKKPETVLYPFEKKEPAPGLKGQIVNHVESCILCGICAKRCPTSCITVDKAARTWTIDHFQCVQCGSCARECPKSCLEMNPAYTPVSRQKHTSVVQVPDPKASPKVEKASA